MIKTKSIYEPKEAADGTRILVTRFYPRGMKKERFDLWAKELAPSADLVKRYKNKQISWKQFAATYRKEIRNNDDSIQSIKKWSRVSSDITLLCYEAEDQPCHRHILKKMIVKPSTIK